MKKLYKATSLLLAAILVFSGAFSAAAFGDRSMTKEEWQQLYQEKIKEIEE